MKTTDIVSQIDKLLVEYGQLRQRSQYDDISNLKDESQAFVIRLRAALDRLAPGANSYAQEMAKVDDDPRHVRIAVYVGILRALRADITDGWVEGIAELIHAATFDDFIDQASELLNKGYKDAAAVVIGSALEAHLRLLRREVCSADASADWSSEEGRHNQWRFGKGERLQYPTTKGRYRLAWYP